MPLLAIETSCDDTSVAIVREGRILSNAVSSQIKLHSDYGGVVPELATREHLHNLMPVARAAFDAAGVKASDIKAVAATQGPGLPNALLIGFKAGQAMAFALEVPFVAVNHHEAHLYSPWIHGQAADFGAFEPNISLIVSGGHTILVHVRGELEHRVIGSTVDDAAGECFDKVGKLIGLPYPGGPEVDRLASEGNPGAYEFPRPMLHDPNDDFSFAGLKTSVRYFLQKNPHILEDKKGIRDLCASVQAAIVEVLVTKTIRAAQRLGVRCITASGGVTCNARLRQDLESACRANGFALRLAERKLCTDNAAMIGILAERKLLRGTASSDLDEDAMPALRLA